MHTRLETTQRQWQPGNTYATPGETQSAKMMGVNDTGHISGLENVTSAPDCDFHLTPVHCSYRLECVGLPFQQRQSLQ